MECENEINLKWLQMQLRVQDAWIVAIFKFIFYSKSINLQVNTVAQFNTVKRTADENGV